MLVCGKHEYIQKAIGWILREVGKKNEKILIDFLQTHWQNLSPTTKSYATEKLRLSYNTKVLFGSKRQNHLT
jgi:3-methyladenine DNA glycosylase AlkD